MKIYKPRIIVFDFETSPQRGWFWGRMWETDIIQIDQYETILSVAWKEHGEKQVHVIAQSDFKGYKPGVLNDKPLCEFFSKIANEYDILCGHNSDQFDITVLNARLAFHKLPPLAVEKSFDTKKLAGKLHLPSRKLSEIAAFFGIPGKYEHAGQKMWFECMQGMMKYWRMMKQYDKQDVVITDKILERLLPFSKQTNQYVRLDGVNINCSNPVCLSENLKKHHTKRVVNGWKAQYQCNDCGKYTTDPKIIKYKKAP